MKLLIALENNGNASAYAEINANINSNYFGIRALRRSNRENFIYISINIKYIFIIGVERETPFIHTRVCYV